MATKKKKAAPRRAAKRPTRRKAASASAAHAGAVPESSSNGLFFALLFVGLAALGWLALRSCTPTPPVPSVAAVPAPPAAPSAAAPAAAPASTAPAAAPAHSAPAATASKVPAPAAKALARHESAASPAPTFVRGKKGRFSLRCWRSAASPAQLDIFGRRNRRVRSLKSEGGAAGWVQLEWDGKDEAGKKVPEGLYFLRSTQENELSVLELRVED
jgi:hypothetical protein